MRSASRLFFSSKLFVKELPNELLVIVELLEIVELLTDELLVLLELLEEKICKEFSV